MKKVILCGLLFLFFITFVSAQANSSKIDQGYSCLDTKISNKSVSSLSLHEAFFGTLALGSRQNLRDKIAEEKNGECWPKPSCNLKDTSLALLSYNRLNLNADSIESYLTSKNSSVQDLTWNLIIDIDQQVPATCTISHSGSQNTIQVGSDLKISGNPGSCFSLTNNDYWLQISPSCINERFDISCDGQFSNFLTALLYQKQGSTPDVFYVSPQTHSASSSGTTTEQITARCLKLGLDCDYEGTLWAALALQKTGNDVSKYIPYLVALAEDNERYLPSAFLHILTGSQEHYSNLVQAQILSDYWQAPATPNNKFYDTSLALLSLQGKTSQEATNAKNYLLEVQGTEGCWNNNNLRDTSFILFSAFPKAQFSTTTPGTTSNSSNSSGTSRASCEPSNGFCGSSLGCLENSGNILRNFACNNFGEVCCSVRVGTQATCAESNGRICPTGNTCQGNSISSSDGTCCLGTCQVPAPSTQNACTQSGGGCYSSCTDSEEQTSASCSVSGQVCCVAKTTGSESSTTWIWILLILILLALVVLGIIYRKKLQLWLFKARKSGTSVSSSPIVSRRPPFTPPSYSGPPISRPTMRPRTQVDRDMEETLRKLKEISK